MEKAFIRKAFEDKTRFEKNLDMMAFMTGYYNARRGNKPFAQLFESRPVGVDRNMAEDNLKKILAIENKEGKKWMKMLRKGG